MSILEVKKYPDKILREKSLTVEKISEKEIKLFQDMLATMYQYSGIGLAAPQVGIKQKIFVVDIGNGPIFLANPELIKRKGKETMEEGCLSVPGATVKIRRPYEVIVKGINEKGKVVEIEAHGLMARVLQHEMNHLDGKLIIDYMDFLKKTKYRLFHSRNK